MREGELRVVRAGALTTVQDLGRPGHAALGVPRSGALDQPAHRLANRLVGNPPGAATLETTLTGVCVRTSRAAVFAVTGAPAAVRAEGRPAAWASAVHLPAGGTLEVGAPTSGLRSYVAVGGGVTPQPVLGSRSRDLLSGLGPPPLADGDTLPVGAPCGPPLHTDLAWCQAPPSELVLPVLLGPREDWFTSEALRTLASAGFSVSSRSNRIALRTEGPPLERAVRRELPSEAMVVGAVQVPTDGRPVVFLADCPTTGGYPVIGVVPESGLAAAAQAVPGTAVRFVPTSRHRARLLSSRSQRGACYPR
ncbi:biotin-dependent carboxyltransferase family protein [Streptomyces sp. JJ66]|uniref:5-oxoprolinase subunit C family protein n=1 Tax=Streptomyces sp. JJ66 TaxID=2803843 RepID=UPI001C572722|nr:biotin-dependent carboxyltransferase family protein [Streptomyces sp. JJ66]MBW1603287.1 biotin-dependent carboxyltransferase family protein [Streptomyces sp. JJ66]